ncbi:MAG: 2-isopropylmalate synthase [Xenococcaceae cyanobacterium]
MNQQLREKISIFDTTMRDGELTPGVNMNLQQKMALAKLLEEIGVDVMEVGYPGFYQKDLAEIQAIAQEIKESTICGLAGSKIKEINTLGLSLKSASRSRINIYTNVNTKTQTKLTSQDILTLIKDSITAAKQYTNEIEWSAFDAASCELDFLCKVVETAIAQGANIVCIPDSFGSLSTQEFADLISAISNRVPNIDRATIAVHCHNDLGLAVDNSIAALESGARQIECSVNGLGARKGNADLAKIAEAISQQNNYQIELDSILISQASELVNQLFSF